ncbi:MAG: SDR family oxidoreductase [Candidatus Promineifilaceae bacterium]
MDLGLRDKVALVTAASKGLGKASALALAAEGARLAICARSAAIEAAAAEVRGATSAEVLAMQADMIVPADVERAVKATLAAYGRLDILVINAGGPKPGRFLELTPADWEAAIQLTLMSAVRLCYAAVPPMLAAGSGSIVAIESVSVKQPIENLLLSNSLRLGVIGLLKTLANELGPQGIRVNSINPTFTSTERTEALVRGRAERSGASLEEEAAKITAAIPLGRMGTPAEFGRTLAWLASPAASFVHGHALMFDGGAVRAAL